MITSNNKIIINNNCCDTYRILVIDFGSQYTQLLLRRIRELGVYSETYSFWNADISKISNFNPNGIILSGGPHSIVNNSYPNIPNALFTLGIPILGICLGMQIMAYKLGGTVKNIVLQREFGCSEIMLLSDNVLIKDIYDYIDDDTGYPIIDVWMSHGDVVTVVPDGFNIVGVNKNQQVAIMINEDKNLYGIQFHPEVTHTKKGKNILERFIKEICCCVSSWQINNITKDIINKISITVGKTDQVLLAFSGGVDSLVTAILLHHAIGRRFICIFIDNGLLLDNSISNRVYDFCIKHYNFNIIRISAEKRFLDALIGITNPEEKRKIIGRVFTEIFSEQISNLVSIKWLAQGTIYSDVIESGMSFSVFKNVIKSHHNVGGFTGIKNIHLLEPIKYLFKDEVRNIGLNLGLPYDIVYSYPFPGPGLAVRILGEVKKEYCEILRKADSIFFEELHRHDWYKKVSQAFAVFLPVYSVGIQGDQRKYKWVIVLRAVETTDFMTANWVQFSYDFLCIVSNRIVNEVEGVSRVVYDISSKPPATIEWE